jgi:hypothetical protein
MQEPAIAFCVREREEPALEIRINFGVFAGREATPAEIDELARRASEQVDEFSIIAEQRHEFAHAVEASLHQVRLQVLRENAPADVDELCGRLVTAADEWVQECFAERHAEISEL